MNLKTFFIAVTSAFVMFAASASTDMKRDDIEARLKPFGNVMIAGAAAEQASGPRSGAEVYQQACFACHTTGALNSPKIGDADAWAPRIAQGFDVMLNHAIQGFNAMPPKGTCGDCSDEEIKVAIEHMIEGI